MPINPDQIERIIQALEELRTAQGGNIDRPVSRLESIIEAENKQETKAEKGIDGGGVAAGIIGAKIAGAIANGMKDLTSMITGNVIASLKQEVVGLADAPRKFTQEDPLKQTMAYVDEMARAGVTVSRDDIASYHQRQFQTGVRRLSGYRTAVDIGGLTPGVVQDFFSDISESLLDFTRNARRMIDSQRKVHENYKVHGE